jgi:hypothetical protein
VQVEVMIVGTSSMLQHKFDEAFEINKGTRMIIQQHGSPREQAEKVVYRNGDSFYFPGTWIVGAIGEAGSNHKLTGSRKSARFTVPAAVMIVEVDVPLRNGDGSSLIRDYEVDSRPVTIPSTKGRIMRHRPRFDNWSAKFNLTIDINVLPEDFVQQLLTEAGQSQGIGDFRPNRKGPFGRFRITSWKPIRKRETL